MTDYRISNIPATNGILKGRMNGGIIVGIKENMNDFAQIKGSTDKTVNIQINTIQGQVSVIAVYFNPDKSNDKNLNDMILSMDENVNEKYVLIEDLYSPIGEICPDLEDEVEIRGELKIKQPTPEEKCLSIIF